MSWIIILLIWIFQKDLKVPRSVSCFNYGKWSNCSNPRIWTKARSTSLKGSSQCRLGSSSPMWEFPLQFWPSTKAGTRKRSGFTTWKPMVLTGRLTEADRHERRYSWYHRELREAQRTESWGRKGKCFYVPVEEIKANNYDLSISEWKKIEDEEVEYEKPEVIIRKIKEGEGWTLENVGELKGMLGRSCDVMN